MFTTPRKGGASSTVESPHKVMPLRGYFVDGIWHCNCSPRLPAVFFKVKKEGKNKGRGFWTCQQPKDSDNGCGFFLWEEDAIKREMKTVITNSRSEPASAKKNNNTPRPKANDGQLMARTNSGGDDEFGAWPLTQQDEDEVIFVAEKKTIPYPETPRKSIKTSAFATPGTKRKRDEVDSLPTPATNSHIGKSVGDIFTTPTTNRKGGLFSGIERRSLASPSITPTPGRFRDTSKESSTPAADEFEITEEVMDLLKDEFISEETSSAVRLVLNRFSMKASGIAKGREITRAALKQKDTKIAELQQRISALENEREMNKALIKRSKNDIRLYTVTADS